MNQIVLATVEQGRLFDCAAVVYGTRLPLVTCHKSLLCRSALACDALALSAHAGCFCLYSTPCQGWLGKSSEKARTKKKLQYHQMIGRKPIGKTFTKQVVSYLALSHRLQGVLCTKTTQVMLTSASTPQFDL